MHSDFIHLHGSKIPHDTTKMPPDLIVEGIVERGSRDKKTYVTSTQFAHHETRGEGSTHLGAR